MLPRLAQIFTSKRVLTGLLFATSLLLACITPLPQPSPPPGNTPSIGSASCSAGQEWCQGRCVDSFMFLNDNQNCGRCGNSCSFNQSCTGGSCSCAAGYESCMGQCKSIADFTSDTQNCGRCGNSCGIGESCLGGSCRKL